MAHFHGCLDGVSCTFLPKCCMIILQVDLLADEVESLLVILEEVQMVFDLYAPILQHYPKVSFMPQVKWLLILFLVYNF